MAQVGGDTYDVVATKTSPFDRGCAVEVDVMLNRSFPRLGDDHHGARSASQTLSHRRIDCTVNVDPTNLPKTRSVPRLNADGAQHNRRRRHHRRRVAYVALIGSKVGDKHLRDHVSTMSRRSRRRGGFLRLPLPMFNSSRPAARNKKLGQCPMRSPHARARSGHAFNLFHPKSDVHSVPIGTTIMNQTGDVMGFSTQTTPYPHNVTFAFDDHNRTSLIHSPDPQVAPGWKRFGWGHGSLAHGIAEPVDAAGFLRDEIPAGDITIELGFPKTFFGGSSSPLKSPSPIRHAAARHPLGHQPLAGDLRLLLNRPP